MGKQISWIALFLLLVVVPFGSWFYLSKGLNFRKHSLSEIVPKDSLSIELDTSEIFRGKTSLVVLTHDDNTKEITSSVYTQFKNTVGFQLVYVDTLQNEALKTQFTKYSGKAFVVIDEKMRVRNSYHNDLESIRKMVEHIAIIIPRPKETDIQMKNQN